MDTNSCAPHTRKTTSKLTVIHIINILVCKQIAPLKNKTEGKVIPEGQQRQVYTHPVLEVLRVLFSFQPRIQFGLQPPQRISLAAPGKTMGKPSIAGIAFE